MMSHADLKKRRPKGRSLEDFKNLTWAEKKLIASASRGVPCSLGLNVPAQPSRHNAIRPELIRFLALGGDDNAPVHARGVQLQGAWIGAALDFQGCRLTKRLSLRNCFVNSELVFRDAHAIILNLEGSVFHGLFADRLKLDGALFLRRVHSKGTVRLLGAEIGGQLDCSGGGFEGGRSQNKDCVALACDGAKIGDSVFLGEYLHQTTELGCPFHAIGEVRLGGVSIGGNLSCIGSGFDNQSGTALICEGARIGGGLFFGGGVSAKGRILLAHASVATLADDLACWPDQLLDLEGFRYERIDSLSSLDADSRIAWLNKQLPRRVSGENFSIQPWIHLAKVLREQGHFREAAEVDIAREERLRAAGKIGDPRALLSWTGKWGQLDGEGRYASFLNSLSEQITWFLHWLYGKFSGYGHRPMRIVYTAMVLWLCGAILFSMAADNAIFSPSNAATAKALRDDCKKQFAPEKIVWTRCDALLKTYPRFSPWAYSLDLILPVARLGQSASWTPVSDDGWLSLSGWTQRLVWFEEIFGWVAALTLAAIAAGLVKRKDG